MCNKNSLNPPHDHIHMPRRSKRIIRRSSIISSMKNREPNNELVSPNKTSWKKSRKKFRKPKFLSLRKQLSQENMNTHQLNLFPLHPENLVDDEPTIDIHDENVALLFHNSEDGEGSASLNGLLTNAYANANTKTTTTTTLSNSEEEDEQYSLVRTAMRSREREYGREEKWVYYSEVVERNEMVELEEDTSSTSAFTATEPWRDQKMSTNVEIKGSSLALKLDDYEGILNAWSDSGRSLYIQRDICPWTVPDLFLDDYFAQDNSMVMDVLGVGDVWKVPEMGSNNVMSCVGIMAKNNNGKEFEGRSENWKLEQREASVLRYKEKRQNRLFSKRIRYQVRKLNAEKRPRMKGRFVKRG